MIINTKYRISNHRSKPRNCVRSIQNWRASWKNCENGKFRCSAQNRSCWEKIGLPHHEDGEKSRLHDRTSRECMQRAGGDFSTALTDYGVLACCSVCSCTARVQLDLLFSKRTYQPFDLMRSVQLREIFHMPPPIGIPFERSDLSCWPIAMS